MVHTYEEISDDLFVKPYLPLFSFLWRSFRELGWDAIDNYDLFGDEGIYSFFETRLNESIQTVKDVVEGRIPHPDRVLSYSIAVPSLVIRSDLVIGMQKLLGGDSVDFTFAVAHDYNSELLLLLNVHIEDGIPVDWFMIRQTDDILDRRHMKLGYKLREIPRRMKDLKKSAKYLEDVCRDMRNERTPQWATSDYYIATIITSWAINLMWIPSNYESIGETYDGWASKEKYGLPDYTFCIHPYPSVFNLFFYQGREMFCRKLASLSTNMDLYIQPFEPTNLELMRNNIPEIFAIYQNQMEKEGVPFPIQTLKCTFPNLKSKDPNIRFEKKYPPGERIKPDDIGLSFDEFLQGVYLDVNHETKPGKIDKSKIKSLGVGRGTKFL
ncbi:MAG: hypothetical protein ACXQS8_02025 [Candidatus Helarchaeales archaeon]